MLYGIMELDPATGVLSGTIFSFAVLVELIPNLQCLR
jgi:hypothetical protein